MSSICRKRFVWFWCTGKREGHTKIFYRWYVIFLESLRAGCEYDCAASSKES